MQAARLLEPRPRTVRSKLIEIVRAFQLEARFSKRDILGIWLTLAPYGGNLEGVRAGALAWFGTSPRQLEPAQAALLVAIPRRPEALRPDRHAERARLLRDRILGADGGDMPSARLALPRHAPQQMASLPRAPRVETTLDLSLQVALERLAAERMQSLPERVSMAIVVADAKSREVRAIVSGAPGEGEGRGGSLDLTRAVRSPGSALKPFIYAMAFQDGVAGPETLMDDTPHRFGAYAPENFDRGFSGNVTAAEALRRSLNVPAVMLLDRVGPQRFAATLQAAGVRLRLRPGAVASLPLALGGAGITLRDLTGLYADLATGGDAVPLRLVAGSMPTPLPFLQPRSAATVANTLVQPSPRAAPPVSPGRPAPVGAAGTVGRSASTRGMSSAYGSGAPTARRSPAPPDAGWRCRCCPEPWPCFPPPRAAQKRRRNHRAPPRPERPTCCACCSHRPIQC